MAKYAVIFTNETTRTYVTGNSPQSRSEDVAKALQFDTHIEASRFASRSAIGGPLTVVEV